ncbi:MAG: hypothetical protein ACOYOE_06780 [Chlorobium sp.]
MAVLRYGFFLKVLLEIIDIVVEEVGYAFGGAITLSENMKRGDNHARDTFVAGHSYSFWRWAGTVSVWYQDDEQRAEKGIW